MEKIIEALREISEKYPIEENFNWELPDDCPIEIPTGITDNFQKNIHLKENLHIFLANNTELKYLYWIIQQWGGIKSLKQNDRNDKKIIKFKNQLNDEKMTKENFGLISSFSKIASFLKPEKYVIYDSRVIYSLNWLIFRYSNQRQFFPQPAGRSAALAKYDMQTIFRLSNQNCEYKSHKTAFFEYCSLLSELSKNIYGESAPPYKIEMLLFLIAPEYIVSDIEKTVKISVE